MATSIKLKHSNTQATIPTTSDLIAGEVALNTVDRKFYVRDGSSAVITLSNHYATDFDTNVTNHHHFYNETTNELIDFHDSDVEQLKLRKNLPGKKIKSIEVLVKVANK